MGTRPLARKTPLMIGALARLKAAIEEYERTHSWSILDWEMIEEYIEAERGLAEALDAVPRLAETKKEPAGAAEAAPAG